MAKSPNFVIVGGLIHWTCPSCYHAVPAFSVGCTGCESELSPKDMAWFQDHVRFWLNSGSDMIAE